jgi:hypothetical protein
LKDNLKIWFIDLDSSEYCLLFTNDNERVTKKSKPFKILKIYARYFVTIMVVDFLNPVTTLP